MKVNKKDKEEILALIRSGYNIQSVCKIMENKTNGTKYSQADIILVAKNAGIKNFGKKEYSEKLSVKESLPALVKDEKVVSKAKKSIIMLLICLAIIVAVIGYIWGLKPMLITLGVVILILIGFVLYCYTHLVKGNINLKSMVKKKS